MIYVCLSVFLPFVVLRLSFTGHVRLISRVYQDAPKQRCKEEGHAGSL